MHWVVLGAGTATPERSRGSAAHLLRGNGIAALFDSGSGTKDRLAHAGVPFGALSHLLYSHAHLDHWADLLPLLFYRASAPDPDRRPGLVVAGPEELIDVARRTATAIDPDLLASNHDILWSVLDPAAPALQAGWFCAQPFAVRHGRRNAFAYRVEGCDASGAPWSVAYSGDSEPCDGLIDAARNVDLFVCECSFPDGHPAPNHMTPSRVRKVAEAAGARQIVLVHLYPQAVQAGLPGPAFEGFEGCVQVACDGTCVPLGRRSDPCRPDSRPAKPEREG